LKLTTTTLIAIILISSVFSLQAKEKKQYYKEDDELCTVHHGSDPVKLAICEGRIRDVSETDKKKIAKRIKTCLKDNEHIAAGVGAAAAAYLDGMDTEDALKCGVLVSSAYESYTNGRDWTDTLPRLYRFAVEQGIYSNCVITEGKLDTSLCNPEVFAKSIVEAESALKPFISQCRTAIKQLKLPSVKQC